jgi:hypothetical protein
MFMAASCKGICIKIKHGPIPNAKKYEFGLKRCSWCEVFLSTDEIRCPCCRMILRTKARSRKKPLSESGSSTDNDTSFSLA